MMSISLPIQRLVNLLEPTSNILLNFSQVEAEDAVRSGDPNLVRKIDGQFAIVQKQDSLVRMARSIGRPMRYFLAKKADGPCLVVAERIDEISEYLETEKLKNQFHPSYTRMVPAHYLVEIALVGCPDPNPSYERFFTPTRNELPSDTDEIGRAYIGALITECERWLDRTESEAPIGVLFSGGVDSGSIFLVLYWLLLQRGESPARLKAFTLSVDGTSSDADQAMQFLDSLGLAMFLEVIKVGSEDIDYHEAVRVIEDYKTLDVQSASMALALCRGIRARYPDLIYLVDGDGGDENLKDYPIEDSHDLTIRSVLNNPLLYQEGWGVDAVKHSLTYSGGQSRGHVRSYAPARVFGFQGFSPYALPNVIGIAESIPFVELTEWSEQRLYDLKGDIVQKGIKANTGIAMPLFEKRRFQHGAIDSALLSSLLPSSEVVYRTAFHNLYD